jgi:HSP20 family molecular chaperone IbpA
MANGESIDKVKPEIVEGKIERTRDRRVFSPRTDIIETGDQYLIVADIPGSNEKEVNITLEKNVLTINATTSSDFPVGKTLILTEFGVGDYYRSFVISDQIDREKIEAKVKNGVLRLILPKAGPAKTQRISIKAG